nr:MAG TPA: hypothetical protein [Caudoviricetes sp.]
MGVKYLLVLQTKYTFPLVDIYIIIYIIILFIYALPDYHITTYVHNNTRVRKYVP